MLAANLVFGALVPTIVPAMALFFGSAGALMPNAVADSIAPFPTQAGSASPLLGFLQMAAATTEIFSGYSAPMRKALVLCIHFWTSG